MREPPMTPPHSVEEWAKDITDTIRRKHAGWGELIFVVIVLWAMTVAIYLCGEPAHRFVRGSLNAAWWLFVPR